MLYPYLITDKSIIDSYTETVEERKDFFKKCKEFAELYDAKAEYTRYGYEIMFSGIVFNSLSQVDFDIWTKPHSNINYSRIRTSKPTKANREKVQEAKEKYNSLIEEKLGEYKFGNHSHMTKKQTDFLKKFGIGKNEWITYTFKLSDDGQTLLLKVDRELEADFLNEILVSEFTKLWFNR